jgi:hypothetical protein
MQIFSQIIQTVYYSHASGAMSFPIPHQPVVLSAILFFHPELSLFNYCSLLSLLSLHFIISLCLKIYEPHHKYWFCRGEGEKGPVSSPITIIYYSLFPINSITQRFKSILPIPIKIRTGPGRQIQEESRARQTSHFLPSRFSSAPWPMTMAWWQAIPTQPGTDPTFIAYLTYYPMNTGFFKVLCSNNTYRYKLHEALQSTTNNSTIVPGP